VLVALQLIGPKISVCVPKDWASPTGRPRLGVPDWKLPVSAQHRLPGCDQSLRFIRCYSKDVYFRLSKRFYFRIPITINNISVYPLEVNGEFTNPDNDDVISTPADDITLSGVVVSRYGEGSLEIFWDRPADSTRRYDVYRNGELVASVPGPSYFNNQINATNAYQYTIIAISHNGSITATGFAQAMSFNGLQCF